MHSSIIPVIRLLIKRMTGPAQEIFQMEIEDHRLQPLLNRDEYNLAAVYDLRIKGSGALKNTSLSDFEQAGREGQAVTKREAY